MKRLITSESVTLGHPDKVCDRISDAILDECLKQDKDSRVACETIANTGLIVVFGEISTKAYVPVEEIVRETIKEIGYTDPTLGFDYSNVAILSNITEQSPDIAQGVDKVTEDKYESIGAGDQGIIFGYANDETEGYLPFSIYYAHRLAERLQYVREEGILPYLRPDGKTQVTVEYDDDKLIRVDNVVVSAQHSEDVSLDNIREDIIEKVIKPVIDEKLIDENTKYYINPTGKFVIGGPQSDSGLCLAEDSLVSLLDKGLTPIKDIKVGDKAITESGIANIIEFYDNGEKDTLVLTDNFGNKIEATPNHPFRVLDKNEKIVWKRADELKQGDFLIRKNTGLIDEDFDLINWVDKPYKNTVKELFGNIEYDKEDIVKELTKYESKDEESYMKLKYAIENDLVFSKLEKIEKSQAHTYDITLDDDTHAFVANGFIVHNTGRKIVVDSYGGYSKTGGGAFSGKDPTKVDRSAAYMARYVAKNIVASGLAKECEIGLSYAIGVSHPLSIFVDTFGTGVLSDDKLLEIIEKEFDFRPAAIIDHLDLQRPIYKETSSYGHFGRDLENFTWEKLNKVEDLKKYL